MFQRLQERSQPWEIRVKLEKMCRAPNEFSCDPGVRPRSRGWRGLRSWYRFFAQICSIPRFEERDIEECDCPSFGPGRFLVRWSVRANAWIGIAGPRASAGKAHHHPNPLRGT